MVDPTGAIEETAKTAGKALDLLNRVFADVPADMVSVLGGAWLHEVNIRLRDRLRRRTEQILRERDAQEVTTLSPNLANALIAAAQEESRDELAELWARLLANAMDPRLNTVRYKYIEMIKKFDPLDVIIVTHIYKSRRKVVREDVSVNVGSYSDSDLPVFDIAHDIDRREDESLVSIQNLEQLELLDKLTPRVWVVNAVCREFMRACFPELGPSS